MERLLKWLLPFLVMLQVILVIGGVVSARINRRFNCLTISGGTEIGGIGTPSGRWSVVSGRR